MFKATSLFRKFVLIALVAALSVAALPATTVYAAGLNDESAPPEMTAERLEKIWRREQAIYERMGRLLERTDRLTGRIQTLIDKANEKGYDTSAVQAALDAFVAAIQEARPIYESAQGIIDSHQGFSADGAVTDIEVAAETVMSMGDTLREIRDITAPSGKALREAIKAFREANFPEGRPGRQNQPEGTAPSFAPSN